MLLALSMPRVIIITASSSNSTSYAVTITTGVIDLAGNHLASPKSWTFTTEAPPTPPHINGTTSHNL
jgi:Bacterial Ig-like domain